MLRPKPRLPPAYLGLARAAWHAGAETAAPRQPWDASDGISAGYASPLSEPFDLWQ